MLADFLSVLRFFLRPVAGAALLLLLFAWAGDYSIGETLYMLAFWLGLWVLTALGASLYKRFSRPSG